MARFTRLPLYPELLSKEGTPKMPDNTEHEIVGVLRDAAATHENAVGPDAEREMHEGVAGLINRIIAGGNSVRRP
jgi:hypothetical protein